MAIRRRAQSFSHLPRPHLSPDEFCKYLGEKNTAQHAESPNPPLGSADDNGAAPEATVVGQKGNGKAAGDEDSQVSPVVVAGVETVEGGVGHDDDGRGGGIPRRLIVRRWPSSADIGMYTDGR